MKIHELQLSSAKERKRVGRGIGSGYGKTAGRGTKGQNARTGGGVRPGFEGGQNPLAKRLPKKRGFVALSHVEFQVVNLSGLEGLKKTTGVIDNTVLAAAGLVRHADRPVKILAQGGLTKKLAIATQAASATAIAAIDAAGGSFKATPLTKAKTEPSGRRRQGSAAKAPAKDKAAA
jgi:large subunit ribosomal protein L15